MVIEQKVSEGMQVLRIKFKKTERKSVFKII
jgi:hypothetical protein